MTDTETLKELAKVINIDRDKRFVPLRVAQLFFNGRGGRKIQWRSLKNKAQNGGIPKEFVRKISYGNYVIDLNYLMGFKTEDTAA